MLEPEHPAPYFWRGRFYGEEDDTDRFMFFSRAALEFMLLVDKQPDVVHLHDWQSAAVVSEGGISCVEVLAVLYV